MPATLDAAALCKMADRGQITGGLLDGPLAFDNAISRAAAKTKHIVSEVAGDPGARPGDRLVARGLPGYETRHGEIIADGTPAEVLSGSMSYSTQINRTFGFPAASSSTPTMSY